MANIFFFKKNANHYNKCQILQKPRLLLFANSADQGNVTVMKGSLCGVGIHKEEGVHFLWQWVISVSHCVTFDQINCEVAAELSAPNRHDWQDWDSKGSMTHYSGAQLGSLWVAMSSSQMPLVISVISCCFLVILEYVALQMTDLFLCRQSPLN